MQEGGSQLSPGKRKPGHDPPHAPLPKKIRPGQTAEQATEVQRAQQGPAQLPAARPSNRDGGKSQHSWGDYHKSMHSKQSFELSPDPSRPPRQGEGSSRSEAANAGWQKRGSDNQAWRGGERTPRHWHGEPQATNGVQQPRYGTSSSHAGHSISPGGAERRRSVAGQGSANDEVAAARPPPQELINDRGLAKTPPASGGAWVTRPRRWQRSQTQPPTEREIFYQLQKQVSELQTELEATNNDLSRIKKDQEAGRRKMQLDEDSEGERNLAKAEENGEAEAGGGEDSKSKKKRKKKKTKQRAVKTEGD